MAPLSDSKSTCVQRTYCIPNAATCLSLPLQSTLCPNPLDFKLWIQCTACHNITRFPSPSKVYTEAWS